MLFTFTAIRRPLQTKKAHHVEKTKVREIRVARPFLNQERLPNIDAFKPATMTRKILLKWLSLTEIIDDFFSGYGTIG